MSLQNKKLAADARSAPQIGADEAASKAAESGEWIGLQREALCTPEGARQLLEHRTELDPAAAVTKHPFRWKEKVFRILRCEYADGEARVEAVPADPDFLAEAKKRIERNRFHVLPYFQGFGFIAFPEDFRRYDT